MDASGVDVVGAVIERGGLILAAQRAAGRSQAGLWEFPGGKVEPGETPAAALRREIAEELGCTVAVGPVIARSEHQYDHGVIVLETYRCTVESGDPSALEHAALRWLPLAELRELDWSPADLPTVDALQRSAP